MCNTFSPPPVYNLTVTLLPYRSPRWFALPSEIISDVQTGRSAAGPASSESPPSPTTRPGTIELMPQLAPPPKPAPTGSPGSLDVNSAVTLGDSGGSSLDGTQENQKEVARLDGQGNSHPTISGAHCADGACRLPGVFKSSCLDDESEAEDDCSAGSAGGSPDGGQTTTEQWLTSVSDETAPDAVAAEAAAVPDSGIQTVRHRVQVPKKILRTVAKAAKDYQMFREGPPPKSHPSGSRVLPNLFSLRPTASGAILLFSRIHRRHGRLESPRRPRSARSLGREGLSLFVTRIA